jgi:hypothetical protein
MQRCGPSKGVRFEELGPWHRRNAEVESSCGGSPLPLTGAFEGLEFSVLLGMTRKELLAAKGNPLAIHLVLTKIP